MESTVVEGKASVSLTINADINGIPIPLETLEDWDRLDALVRQFFAIAEELEVKEQGVTVLCGYCGNPFSPSYSRTKKSHNIYCSTQCYQKAYRRKHQRKTRTTQDVSPQSQSSGQEE